MPQNMIIVPPKVTITQTIVSVTATSGQLVKANPTRKLLQYMVIGANDVTVVPGTTAAVSGSGMVLSAGSGTGKQGASQVFDAVVPTNAFQVICASGLTSTVVVWEGN